MDPAFTYGSVSRRPLGVQLHVLRVRKEEQLVGR
jgi:hypothetical protein